jgi:mono/diheme cytochrome c family protein
MIAVMTMQRSVAYVIGFLVFGGAVFVIAAQMRKGRAEVGSEIELAANRKPYLPDEELETSKLNLALWVAFGLLIVVALSLPLYWLAEPGRQDGAKADYLATFEKRGEELYAVGAQCVNCHGPEGVGGSANYIITDENGKFVQQVTWRAPALNTLLYRFSKAEVKDVLYYGRPGSPMAAWGTKGGGPFNEQQLDNIVDYLWTVQLTPDEVHKEVDDAIAARDEGLASRMLAVREANKAVVDPTGDDYQRLSESDELLLGEILFNLTDVGAGAYSCARCHVPGASFDQAWAPISETARGSYGFDLVGIEKTLTPKQHFNLIFNGSEFGKSYGTSKVGSGRMPGFGTNANNGTPDDRRFFGATGMLSAEQVWSIVTYERNLSSERAVKDAASAGAPAQEGAAK